jgi:hypothetical protein
LYQTFWGYDFYFFRKNIGEKIAILAQNTAFRTNLIVGNIGFKQHFSRRKL